MWDYVGLIRSVGGLNWDVAILDNFGTSAA